MIDSVLLQRADVLAHDAVLVGHRELGAVEELLVGGKLEAVDFAPKKFLLFNLVQTFTVSGKTYRVWFPPEDLFIRAGFIDELPSGNADLAPTIAWILGIDPSPKMDGRVLLEALGKPPESAPQAEEKTLEVSHETILFHWRQYLKVKTVGAAIYFDEGNGESVQK